MNKLHLQIFLEISLEITYKLHLQITNYTYKFP